MLLSDFWISMRPLLSYMLFKPIDYIFVTCFMKCLSCLVGEKSSPYESSCTFIIILLLSFSFENVMEFSTVT